MGRGGSGMGRGGNGMGRGGSGNLEVHMGQSNVRPYSEAESIFCCKVSTIT